MKTPSQKPLTPGQVLLILLVVPAATYGLLEMINPDKGSLLIAMFLVPVLLLAWKGIRAFLGMLSL